MAWQKPEFIEINMSAEIGGYQDELEERRAPSEPPAVKQPDKDYMRIRPELNANPCARRCGRRRLSTMELWLFELPWRPIRIDQRPTTHASLYRHCGQRMSGLLCMPPQTSARSSWHSRLCTRVGCGTLR